MANCSPSKVCQSSTELPATTQAEQAGVLFTVEELRQYDGIQNEKILLAVNGIVYDVTSGREHYGPGGSYADLAGRDATRGLCLFEVVTSDEPVDVSTLTQCEAESLYNWAQFYAEKYPAVGRLAGYPLKNMAQEKHSYQV